MRSAFRRSRLHASIHVLGHLMIRVRCIDVNGAYSEGFQNITINEPSTPPDVNAIGEQLNRLKDQQNTGQVVGLATAYVSTVATGDREMTDEEKKLQQSMTDSVS